MFGDVRPIVHFLVKSKREGRAVECELFAAGVSEVQPVVVSRVLPPTIGPVRRLVRQLVPRVNLDGAVVNTEVDDGEFVVV